MSAPPPFRPPAPRAEPSPRWIRVRAGGEWIADSRRAQLVAWYGPGRLPTYAIPPEDVRADLLDLAGGAARRIDAPEPELAAVRGHWTFTWDDRVEWFEEAQRAHVHARDTAKRVDTVPSERHMRVAVDGVVLAESRRPVALFETSVPTRWYVPREDLAPGVLEPSDTVTRCPYKGTASYLTARAGDAVHPDIAWAYAEPVPECPRIAGMVAFFNERVDLVIDGEPQERPVTPWSPGGPAVTPPA